MRVPFVSTALIELVMVLSTSSSPPPINLQFYTEIHAANGYAHGGDGCVPALAELSSDPAVQHVWFDYLANRFGQTNPGFAKPAPIPNVTYIALFDKSPPMEMDVQKLNNGKFECETEPLPDIPCPNGTVACPPVFGWWGGFNFFTGVFGMYYPNTTLLSVDEDKSEIWQWEWVNPTLMPNGSYVNITRNFTYFLAPPSKNENRTVKRFQWTQGIPGRPNNNRDCFIFDYQTNYLPGPVDPSRWLPPANTTCQPGRRESLSVPARESSFVPRSVLLTNPDIFS